MVLMVLGALIIAGGFSSVIYGNFMNNDFSSQLFYSDGLFDDPGTIWMICGGVAIVFGILMVLAGSEDLKSEKMKKMIFICKKCKSTYSELSGTKNYCPDCNKPLIETQITRDYWRSLTDTEKELLRNKIVQDLYLQE